MTTPALFDLAAGAHIVHLDVDHDTVHVGDSTTLQTWHRWECLCGQEARGRWSHRELAERMATKHMAEAA